MWHCLAYILQMLRTRTIMLNKTARQRIVVELRLAKCEGIIA
jgi:hypothetical protein